MGVEVARTGAEIGKAVSLPDPQAQEGVAARPEFSASSQLNSADPLEVKSADASYTYTTAEGTTYHAKSRDEAIGACSVLASMTPAARNALFDAIDKGRAEMAKAERQPEGKRPTSQKSKQTEQAARPEGSVKSAEQTKPQPAEKADGAAQAKAVTADVAMQRPVQDVRNLAEDRIVREQWIRETAHVIVPDKIVATVLNPQPYTVEVTDRAVRREVVEAEQVAELNDTRTAIDQEQIEDKVTGAVDAIMPDEVVIFKAERPVIEQQTDEEGETALAAETTLQDGSTESVELMIEPADDVPVAEPVLSDKQAEYMDWADELDKAPMRIYEDFSEALQFLVDLSNGQSKAVLEDEPTEAAEVQNVHTVPVIAVTVAERLGDLEIGEKEAVALVLADIVETMQVVAVLAAEEAEPEAIETVQAELEESVAELFERLGIEYEAEDVDRFIAVLLRSDFQPPAEAPEVIVVDLEHDGTHEGAKRRLSRVLGNLSDTEDKTQGLGKLILFYVMGSRPRIQTPVY